RIGNCVVRRFIVSRGGGWQMMVEMFPLQSAAKVEQNAGAAELIEQAIANGEGHFTASGALSVETGVHTRRTELDKFTVRDAATEKAVWWDNSRPMTPEHFDLLAGDFLQHAKSRNLYVQDLFAGAAPAHRLNVRIFLEYAWHAAFIRNLLRR